MEHFLREKSVQNKSPESQEEDVSVTGLSHERENSTVHRPNRYNKKCMSPIILPRGLRCVFYIYLSRAKRSLVSCSTIFSSTPILLLTYPRVLNLRQNKKKENTTLRVSHDLHPRKFLTMVGTYLFKAAILITLLSTTYLRFAIRLCCFIDL